MSTRFSEFDRGFLHVFHEPLQSSDAFFFYLVGNWRPGSPTSPNYRGTLQPIPPSFLQGLI